MWCTWVSDLAGYGLMRMLKTEKVCKRIFRYLWFISKYGGIIRMLGKRMRIGDEVVLNVLEMLFDFNVPLCS